MQYANAIHIKRSYNNLFEVQAYNADGYVQECGTILDVNAVLGRINAGRNAYPEDFKAYFLVNDDVRVVLPMLESTTRLRDELMFLLHKSTEALYESV